MATRSGGFSPATTLATGGGKKKKDAPSPSPNKAYERQASFEEVELTLE